jgi:ATP-dependent DNA helicase RecG
LGALMAKLAGGRVVDLCWHLPVGTVDRRFSPKLNEAPVGAVVTVSVSVDSHRPARHQRQPYKIFCHDDSGELTLVFFNAKADYLLRLLPEGEVRIVSGRLDRFEGELQMTHPDYIVTPANAKSLPAIEPVYPLTAGLTPKVLAKVVAGALSRAPDLPEWQDPTYRSRQAWTAWREALATAHHPQGGDDLAATAPARRRLAYDELLASQLALALVRAHHRRQSGRALSGDGRLRAKARAALPFTLTPSQERAIEEIAADMASGGRMLRLLQGDVGSGKTVVALFAMLIAVEAGAQAALLAPTDILARQHFATIEPLAAATGVELRLLTGRDKGRAREAILAGLASGATPLVVGTHALIQEDVAFKDLALAVVDEQHRFGVHQRVMLGRKGHVADVLAMTATPIPRTLLLAAYGDLDVSRLIEKPAGRKPVDTRAVPLERLDEVVGAVGRAIAKGDQVFWVCPLVEESENLEAAAATERHAMLAKTFGADRVGLVHGQQKAAERDAAMIAFASGRLSVLVATTVIEVGVDVPAASVMVIEHAEHFGLAQLHQLRGRVGRGEKRSTCLLLYRQPLGETAKARLNVLRETEDGFRIAEEDLRLRGGGEVLGTRQSGLPEFRLADLVAHADLLQVARDDARLVADSDPDLKGPRGPALRVLLYLFEREAAVQTLRSG